MEVLMGPTVNERKFVDDIDFFRKTGFIPKDPLKMFVVASRFGWETAELDGIQGFRPKHPKLRNVFVVLKEKHIGSFSDESTKLWDEVERTVTIMYSGRNASPVGDGCPKPGLYMIIHD